MRTVVRGKLWIGDILLTSIIVSQVTTSRLKHAYSSVLKTGIKRQLAALIDRDERKWLMIAWKVCECNNSSWY